MSSEEEGEDDDVIAISSSSEEDDENGDTSERSFGMVAETSDAPNSLQQSSPVELAVGSQSQDQVYLFLTWTSFLHFLSRID